MKGNFDALIKDNRPVIIDFHAEWCGPCKVQSPILQEISAEMGEKVRVIKIDVDQNQQLAVKYNIQGVPTIAVFKNGELKYRQAGVHSKAQILNILNHKL